MSKVVGNVGGMLIQTIISRTMLISLYTWPSSHTGANASGTLVGFNNKCLTVTLPRVLLGPRFEPWWSQEVVLLLPYLKKEYWLNDVFYVNTGHCPRMAKTRRSKNFADICKVEWISKSLFPPQVSDETVKNKTF